MVTQLRRRGWEVVAKTNMDQFGMGSYSIESAWGSVKMPEQTDSRKQAKEEDEVASRISPRSVGGSSGGSAVAVMTGDADLALGTDTGGSVRLPAAWTGTVGFKPSYGMVSRWGVVAYANSLDTVGFIARDVRTIRDVVVGDGGLHAECDGKDPTCMRSGTRARCLAQREGYGRVRQWKVGMKDKEEVVGGSLKGITVGIPKEYNVVELSPVVRSLWAETARKLRRRGAEVVSVSLPMTRHALSTYYVLAPAEASSNLAKFDGVRYGRRAAKDRADGEEEEEGRGRGQGAEVQSNIVPLYAPTRGAFFGDEVKRRILLGSYSLSSEAMNNYFVQAQKARRLVRRDFDRVFRLTNPLIDPNDADARFGLCELGEEVAVKDKSGPEQVDFLLCPTAPGLAPRIAGLDSMDSVEKFVGDVFTVGPSLAGVPALSVPIGTARDEDGDGFVGMQLIGQYWDDARVLELGEVVMMDAMEQ